MVRENEMRKLLLGAVLVMAWVPCTFAGGSADVHLVYTSEVRGTVGICG